MVTNRAPDRYAAIGPTIRLLRALRVQWLTLDELAARLGVHRRTIMRRLAAVRAADLDVQARRRAGDGMTPTEYRVTRIL